MRMDLLFGVFSQPANTWPTCAASTALRSSSVLLSRSPTETLGHALYKRAVSPHLRGLDGAAVLIAGARRDDQLRRDAAHGAVRDVAAQVAVVARRKPRRAGLCENM